MNKKISDINKRISDHNEFLKKEKQKSLYTKPSSIPKASNMGKQKTEFDHESKRWMTPMEYKAMIKEREDLERKLLVDEV